MARPSKANMDAGRALRERVLVPLVGLFQQSVCCRQPRNVRGQLRRVMNPHDAVFLLQQLGNTFTSTDDLCSLIVKAYRVEQPSEIEMRRLSLMYQSTEGGADVMSFATLTLWLCAVESFCPPIEPTSSKIDRVLSHGTGLTALGSLTRVRQLSHPQHLNKLETRGMSVPADLHQCRATYRRVDSHPTHLDDRERYQPPVSPRSPRASPV